MVNKAVLGVLGVIVVATLGVGALVGMQMGDAPTTDDSPDDGPGTSPTDTNDSTNGGNGTIAPGTETATPTLAPSQHTPIPHRRFSAEQIARNVTQEINALRAEDGDDPLQRGGNLAGTVAQMATDHSVDMANLGIVNHTIEGNNSADRYREYSLFDACKYQHPEHGYLVTPEDNTFEVVGFTMAGETFEHNGSTDFNVNESQVAADLVENWANDPDAREKLLQDGFERLGVGIEVTRHGEVYATVGFCG